MYILGICSSPEVLEIMQYVKLLIQGIMILAPILIIVNASIEIMRLVASPNPEVAQQISKIFVYRAIACAVIILVPTLVNIILDMTGSRYGYEECISLATTSNITDLYLSRAESLVTKAEETLSRVDLTAARNALKDVEDETSKNNLETRLETVEASIEKIEEEEKKKEEEEEAAKGTPIEVGPGTGSNGSGTCQMNVALSYEPNPADPISCYPTIVSMSNFIFPTDSNGRKLGSFPKNYASIPTQLTNYKTYMGEFIIPTTPVRSKYEFVYEHNGIDFMAVFGTPIYSPVDGTLEYSEWGHTGNTGGDETAYSLSIKMDRPVMVNGKEIGVVFLTHLSGIRYRCSPGSCNRKVRKGELVGFTGNAAGSATTGSWAPHLHMSMYPVGKYSDGLRTNEIEKLYNLTNGMTLNAGD